MNNSHDYFIDVPDSTNFIKQRNIWHQSMANDKKLRSDAVNLTLSADTYKYGYQWEWCGVPIIRHPDDIVLQQEIMFKLRPIKVIETGIARGGSLVLSSTLQKISDMKSQVLGIDIKIFDHALSALKPWIDKGEVEIIECDSTSEIAFQHAKTFLTGIDTPCLLILDSDHSHSHVLKELSLFCELLPKSSMIMVADTIIEEMPDGYYKNRPWGKGNNPFSAIQLFLKQNQNWELDKNYSRRSLMGEFRDGILTKIA